MAVAALFFSSTPAAASVALGAAPTRFDITVDPGNTSAHAIWVVNDGQESLSIRSYAMDRNLGRGVQEFTAPGNKTDSAAAWVRLDPESFDLLPGGKRQISWRAEVPEDATPGDHLAVIFFETAPAAVPGRLGIGARVGAIVNVRVSGTAVESARFLGASLGSSEEPKHAGREGSRAHLFPLGLAFGREPLTVTGRFQNTGNIRIPLTAEASAKGLFGGTVKLTGGESGTLYPGESGDISLRWADTPPVGVRTVRIRFQAGSVQADVGFLVFFVPERGISSLVLIAAGLWLLSYVRRLRPALPPAARPAPED